MKSVIRKKRAIRSREKGPTFQQTGEGAHEYSSQVVNAEQSHQELDVKEVREPETVHKLKAVDEETMGERDSQDQSKNNHPYEFLNTRNPTLRTIFMPRFALLSITFALSVVLTVLFAALIIYSSLKTQNDFAWNCSLFELQNKYFPRLRYDYQLWRVLVSGFFHSNIAHFVLNLFGLQIYGYFVEWYYGKLKYCLTLGVSLIMAHFLSAVTQPTTISTTSSTFLYSILILKAIFLFQHRNYKALDNRRVFLYLLFFFIAMVNLLPVFVVNNVDYGAHLAGVICGALLGTYFYVGKGEDMTTKHMAVRFAALGVLGCTLIGLIAAVFSIGNDQYIALNDNIAIKCL